MEFVEISQAWDIIKNNIKQVNRVRKVKLTDCCGKIVSRDYYALMDNPPFDRSPLDGFACRSEDMQSLMPLTILDKIYAGSYTECVVEEGTCVALMTGAPIPQGADCVIKQEDVEIIDGKINYTKPHKHLQNIVFKGEDIKKDELIISKDTTITKMHICVLASVGIEEVEVYDDINVGVITTGDEVVQPGSDRTYAQIYDSTSTYIMTSLKEVGVHNYQHYECSDNTEDLINKLNQALEASDLVITTGGVSVGEKDLLEDTLLQMGAKVLFHGVRMKPGSPVMVSTLDDKVIVSLSGNPFAALATFEVICKPCLHAMNSKYEDLLFIDAISDEDYDKVRGHMAYVRAIYHDGKVTIPLANHSSGSIKSMIGCNCLVEILPNTKIIKDMKVRVVLIEK